MININQSIEWIIDEWINQSIIIIIKYSISNLIEEWMNEWMNQSSIKIIKINITVRDSFIQSINRRYSVDTVRKNDVTNLESNRRIVSRVSNNTDATDVSFSFIFLFILWFITSSPFNNHRQITSSIKLFCRRAQDLASALIYNTAQHNILL